MGPLSSPPPNWLQQLSLVRTRPPPVSCPRLTVRPKRKGVEGEEGRSKVFLLILYLLLFQHLLQPLRQFLQRKHTEVSKNPSQGLVSIQAPQIKSSIGCSLPVLQHKVTFGFACLGDTNKRLREKLQFPPRPSPRVPDPRTGEEWGIQEAASLLATTRGQISNQGQGSSTSLGPPRPKPSVTTMSSATSLAATSGQSSEVLLATLAAATTARGARQSVDKKVNTLSVGVLRNIFCL